MGLAPRWRDPRALRHLSVHQAPGRARGRPELSALPPAFLLSPGQGSRQADFDLCQGRIPDGGLPGPLGHTIDGVVMMSGFTDKLRACCGAEGRPSAVMGTRHLGPLGSRRRRGASRRPGAFHTQADSAGPWRPSMGRGCPAALHGEPGGKGSRHLPRALFLLEASVCSSITKELGLAQGSAKFLWKGPDSQCFRLCEARGLYFNYQPLPLH